MFRLFLTPEWFEGVDLIFNAVSLIVAMLIAGYSWKVYRISKENRFSYFSLAFVMVSFSLLMKIITQGLNYYTPWRDTATVILVPIVGAVSRGADYSELFYRSGFFLSMVSMLGAWLLIFFISQKRTGRLKRYYDVSQISLFVYLILLISVVANFTYSVFYLTSSVILGMTVLNYYKNYLNTDKNINAFRVMFAFLSILFGNILLVFVFFNQGLYVFGEAFVLGGFLVLLYTYRKIVSR